jgi:hypothetical protein
MYSKIAFRRCIALFVIFTLWFPLSGEVAPVGANNGTIPNQTSRAHPLSPSAASVESGDILDEISELAKEYENITSTFSSVGNGIKMAQAIGQALGLIGDKQQENFDRIHEHLDRILIALIKADTWRDQDDRLDKLTSALSAIDRNMFTPDINYDTEVAVKNAGKDSASIRGYSEKATNGGKVVDETHWKSIIDDRPPHPDDLVIDWRIGVPHLMQLIALRLTVIAQVDPNFLSDDDYDKELMVHRHALLNHYNRMLEGVKCGESRWNSTGTKKNLACADIYTGEAAYATVYQDQPWTPEGLIKKEKEIQNTLAALRWEVRRKMPFFEMRSMIDALYLYVTGKPDLTEVLHRIPVEAAPNLCLDVKGGNPAPGTLVWLWECNGSDAQKWVYNRQNHTIYNPVYGKYLDVQWGNPRLGAPVWIWDQNGTDAQRWTYDAENRILQNALGTVLNVAGPIQSESPVNTWAIFDGSKQRWLSNFWVGHPPGAKTFSVDKRIYTGEYVNQSLLAEISSGSIPPDNYSFEPVPYEQYDVAEGHIKGLPPGLLLDQGNGNLSGLTQANAGQQYNTHFFVVNTKGEKVAQMRVLARIVGASDQVSSLVGSLSAVNCGVISGQAWDQSQLQRVVSVDIYDGNTLLARISH